METTKTVPQRRGTAKTITLSPAAVLALEALAAGPRTYGRLISELLTNEMSRREERQLVRHTREDVLCRE
jgi:hypothetical protein